MKKRIDFVVYHLSIILKISLRSRSEVAFMRCSKVTISFFFIRDEPTRYQLRLVNGHYDATSKGSCAILNIPNGVTPLQAGIQRSQHKNIKNNPGIYKKIQQTIDLLLANGAIR